LDNSQAKNILEKLVAIYPSAKCELNFSTPFELLVAVILSAQCTDKRVNIITEKLFNKFNKPFQFAKLSIEELSPYIYSCGFYNNKGLNIIKASKIIHESYGDKVPQNMEQLLALPGVGRKTASVILSEAYLVPAIPVDTHVFRVSKRIGFSKGENSFKVESDLSQLFPPEKWYVLHHTLISHGRNTCKAIKPLCIHCSISKDCFYNINK
jgi:endonuclease III